MWPSLCPWSFAPPLYQVPDSLMLKFGIHILKVISKNSIGDFKLYDWGKRGELLTEMLARLTPDESSRFSIGQYTNFGGHPYPCIRLSPSSEYLQLFFPKILIVEHSLLLYPY